VEIFFDDASVNRTQGICVLFSPPVLYHDSQLTNIIRKRKMNELNELMSSL